VVHSIGVPPRGVGTINGDDGMEFGQLKHTYCERRRRRRRRRRQRATLFSFLSAAAGTIFFVPTSFY
jgi:hypothetical protein